MHGEPEDLIEARALLVKFEAEIEMGRPAPLGDLTSALSLLAYVRANASTEFGQVVTNLAIAYAKSTQVVVESLLAREPSLHGNTVDKPLGSRSFSEEEEARMNIRPITRSPGHVSQQLPARWLGEPELHRN